MMSKILPYHSVERAEAVSALVRDWWNRPLEWGLWDCANMCRDMAIKLGADDPMKDWPKYGSKREARATLKAQGFKTLTEAVTSKCEKLEAVGFVGLGDIVEIKSRTKELPALGIWVGQDAVLIFGQVLTSPDEIRVQRIDMQYFTGNAWRVI